MVDVLGQPVKRHEDDRLVQGRGQYTDDIRLPGMVYAHMVRSPHAHAKIKDVDKSAALALPGVLAVFAGADLKDQVGMIPTAWIPPNADMKMTPHPALAYDTVRYVGDGVAVVIAEDPYTASDAADLVRVTYAPLDAVVHPREATGFCPFHWPP